LVPATWLARWIHLLIVEMGNLFRTGFKARIE
jgi:hypothetical protein